MPEVGPGTRRLILGFWTVVAVLETAKEFTTARLTGADRDLIDALIVNFPWWFFWAPATFLVLYLARRWPVDRAPRATALAVHLVASVVIALAHMAIVATTVHYGVVLDLRPEARWVQQFAYWISAYVVLDVLVYWMVLGAQHALVYRRRLVEGRAREAEARLAALRMELNPHFLFNSLNSVAGLVESGDGARATTMIARLSDLLRRTLDHGRTREVPLADEMETVQRYLWIEQVRFGDRLTVELDVEEGLERVAVPPMILQPLVENAIRHGASKRPGPVSVRVSARRDGGRLRIAVEDDGPGPGPEGSTRPGSGVGLANVRGRLEVTYGPEAELSLDPAPQGGAVATLQLPLRESRLQPDETK